jgi:hypothetical protein
MTLFGNGCRVTGSITGISVPLTSKLREKSPVRSNAVGVFTNRLPRFFLVPVNSCDQKKNNLSRLVLNLPGMKTGPPSEYPEMRYRYGVLGVFVRLLKKSFAFKLSWR